MEPRKPQQYNQENRRYDGPDRRKASVEMVDGKIAELEYRRDLRLEEKLKAMEILFEMTVNTKSDAHSIAIARIQGDTGECRSRCTKQVNEFYDIINAIKLCNGNLNAEFSFMKTTFAEHENDADGCFKSNEEENKKIKERLVALEEWKKYFWMINIPIIVTFTSASIITIYKVAELGYRWYHSFSHIKDVHP